MLNWKTSTRNGKPVLTRVSPEWTKPIEPGVYFTPTTVEAA